MNDLKKRQKDMYQGLLFGTILLIIIIILFWTIPELQGSDSKIKLTIATIIAIPFAWILFYRQKKIDEGKIKQEKNVKEGVYKGVHIVQGVGFKFNAIRYLIVMILFLGGGIWILVTGGEYWWVGLILIGVAILLPIAIKTFWKVGGQKLKGRNY